MYGGGGYGGRGRGRGGGGFGGRGGGRHQWGRQPYNAGDRGTGGAGIQGLQKAPDYRGHKSTIRAIACNTEGVGQGVYTAGQDQTVRVWDITAAPDKGCLNQVPVGGDAQSILIAGGWLFVGVKGMLRAWNLASGAQQDMPGHQGEIYAIAADLTRGLIFSAGQDKIIRVWKFDDASQRFLGVGQLDGHAGGVMCLLAEGGFLLSGSTDKTIKVWNLDTASCVCTATGHAGAVMSMLLWSGCIISCALDGVVCAWSIEPGAQLCQVAQHPPKEELGGNNGRGRGRAGVGADGTYRGGAMRMCGTVRPGPEGAEEALLVVAYLDQTVCALSLPDFQDKGLIRSPVNNTTALLPLPGLFLTGDAGGALKVWRWQAAGQVSPPGQGQQGQLRQ